MDHVDINALEWRYIELFTDRLDDGSTWSKFGGFCIGPGWGPIVRDMLAEMSAQGCTPIIEQIALGEHGCLEVLRYRSDAKADAAIERAEEKSMCTCAECGGARDMRPGEYDWSVGLCRGCLSDLRRRDARH